MRDIFKRSEKSKETAQQRQNSSEIIVKQIQQRKMRFKEDGNTIFEIFYNWDYRIIETSINREYIQEPRSLEIEM